MSQDQAVAPGLEGVVQPHAVKAITPFKMLLVMIKA